MYYPVRMPSVFPTIQGANLNEDESNGDCDYVCWDILGSASHNATANPTRPRADANCARGPDAIHTPSPNHRAYSEAGGAGCTATEERDQGSGRVQRLRRGDTTEGSDRADQRPGSVPGSVPQQRDERRCAGNAHGGLPENQ